ncbi:MAG: phospho-N-acetylmuramoyl-pentapeptide-transferase [Erysipelotrichaceae bacterium]|nr:phospho-N-acetylmuramoyl-pentapeptide-transferase [Erysipelotrichaceae bacterium]
MRLLILSLLSVFLYSLYIRIFKRAKQYEREEGLESHKRKSGTITMGGIIFIMLPLFFIFYDSKTTSIAITIFLYGLLGFVDDLLIIIKKNNKGIHPSLKLFIQVIIAAISFLFFLNTGMKTQITIFNHQIDIKWIYGMMMLFVLTSSTNAFNLTDGVDGLCSGLALIMSLGFLYIAYKKGEYSIMSMIIVIMIPLFVFWCFNYPKAFLFMGDTGSLYLGAFYAMLAVYLDCLFLFIIMAALFVFEVISVIIQVFYFKRTNGKRIFKMTPFHHHLEASGFKEISVDLIFYLIQIILVIFVIIIY